MPWRRALSARPDERRDAQAGDRGRVLEGEEQAETGPLVRGEGQDVATLPVDLATGHDVGRMAGQRVGERGLARAVGAHDRVDLAAADRQVDALQDVVLAVGDGRDAQAADHEVLVGGLGHGVVRLPAGRGRSGRWPRPPRGVAERGPRGSSSRGSPAIASRTRTHRRLTVHRALRSQPVACSGSSLAQIIGAIGPSRAREDVAHRDVGRRAGKLVAAVRAAGRARRDPPRGGSRRAARGRPGEGPPPPRHRRATPARSRSGARAGPSAGRRTRPWSRRRRRRIRDSWVAWRRAESGSWPRTRDRRAGRPADIRVISSGLVYAATVAGVNARGCARKRTGAFTVSGERPGPDGAARGNSAAREKQGPAMAGSAACLVARRPTRSIGEGEELAPAALLV